MPVPRMSMRERSDHPLGGKPFNDERIFVDVNVIIKIDEVVSQRLAKYSPGVCHQTKTDNKVGDPWFRVPRGDSGCRGRDNGQRLAMVRNLPLFRATGVRATNWHLLFLDHVAVRQIEKEQYCFPARQPVQGCPGKQYC